ncbi:MAG: C45 family autoproteolytic acyltransferase/hydrolase [Promethearchaeota archaeon]|jgi:predicted choloylglycine hydrolase
MKSNAITGNYYDIGFKMGSQYKSFFQPPPCPPKKLEFSRQCKEIAKQYIPDLLEEIKGFCDGGNYDLESMEAFLLALGFESLNPQGAGCTVFAIGSDLTDSGFPIFARNYDWDETFQDYCGVSFNHPEGKLKSISFSDHMIGNYGGKNEAGLTMAILIAAEYSGKWQPGIRVNLSSRWVLDNCRTTEEAVAFLEKIPHVRGQFFMIADKEDNFARVETAPPHVGVTNAKNDYLCSTNHYQAKSLKQYSDPVLFFPNSYERFNKVKKFLENRKSKITMNEVRKFLSSHKEGVCNHIEFEETKIKTSTLYSWLTEINEETEIIQLLATLGSPCKNNYEQYICS